MGGEFLGEFEQMVLLAVVRLGEDAYGASVSDELERVAGRSVASGALYTTLDRLERKGLVASRRGRGDAERGGRPRRYLEVTGAGAQALQRTRDALDRLWESVELSPGRAR